MQPMVLITPMTFRPGQGGSVGALLVSPAMLTFLTVLVQSQPLAQVQESDCDSCVVTRSEVFEGAALAGHINGGAELFREYGFKRLTVQEVRVGVGREGSGNRQEGSSSITPDGRRQGQNPDAEELIVECYHMKTPSAAYGIYSISRHGCETRDTAFLYSCSGPYQIQCAADSWYVRILNGTGSARAQGGSRTLLRALVARFGQSRIQLPSLFLSPHLHSVRDQVLLITGQLGLQNGLPDWAELLDGPGSFTLYASHMDGEQGTIAELQLASPDDAAVIAQRIGVPVTKRTVQQTAGMITGYAVWRSPVDVRILETSAPRSALGDLLIALAAEGG